MLRYVVRRYATFWDVTLRCKTLHYVVRRCATLWDITLSCETLRYFVSTNEFTWMNEFWALHTYTGSGEASGHASHENIYFCLLLFTLFEISPFLKSCAFRRAQVIVHAHYAGIRVQWHSIFWVFPCARLGKAQFMLIANSMTSHMASYAYWLMALDTCPVCLFWTSWSCYFGWAWLPSCSFPPDCR